MNIKNNKGITLSTTIIAVILLITIMSSIIYSASKVLETKAATQLNNDIAELNRKVNLYYLQNGIIPIDQASGVIYEDSNGAKYYRLVISAIENVNLRNQEEKDKDGNLIKCYVINYETHTIYYVRNEGGTWKPVEYKYVEGYDEFIEKAQTAIKFNKQVTDNEIALNPLEYPQIGDYVNYIYDKAEDYEYKVPGYNDQIMKQEDLKWRILSTEEKDIVLISEKETEETLLITSMNGYNNAVFYLNDICKKHYSNTNLGIEARAFNIEDMEKQYNENGILAKNNYVAPNNDVDSSQKYGIIKSYSSSQNKRYPALYAQEIGSGITGAIREGGISQSDPYYTNKLDLVTVTEEKIAESSSLKATQTFYSIKFEEKYFKNKDFFKVIYTKMSYFLASRAINCARSYAEYCFFKCSIDDIEKFRIYNSAGYGVTTSTPLKPVVTIPSDKYDLNKNEEGIWDIYYKGTENKVFE